MKRLTPTRDRILDEIAEAVFYKLLEEGVIDYNGQYVNEGWKDNIRKGIKTAAVAATLALSPLAGSKAQARDVKAPEQTYQMTRDTSTQTAKDSAQVVQDSVSRVNDAITNFVQGTGGEYSRLFASQFFKGVSVASMEKEFYEDFKVRGSFTVTLPYGKARLGRSRSDQPLSVFVMYDLSKPKSSQVQLTLLGTTESIPGASGDSDSATFDRVQNSGTPLGDFIIDQITAPLAQHKWESVLERVLPVFKGQIKNFDVSRYKRVMGENVLNTLDRTPKAVYDATMRKLDSLGGAGKPAMRLITLLRNPDLNPVAAVKNIDGIF